MKKLLIPLVAVCIALVSSSGAYAQSMNMYVSNQPLVRDIVSVSGFDMLPILDIAGELGFQCYYDGNSVSIYNDSKTYVFTLGDASVYDESGNWYGLDVVPQALNGSVRVPAKFFQDVMGMSYVWDSVTNTIFMNSEDTYNWLINTEEYKNPPPSTMEGVYYQFLRSTGTIRVASGDTVGNQTRRYDVDELWYYVDDVNYDGVKDLVVSGEDYNSNGIVIFTYRNGQVVRALDEGMPFSSGITIFTLATKNGVYGVMVYRQNSAQDFAFSRMWGDWTAGTDTYGFHLGNEWMINGGNVGQYSWQRTFSSIKPVAFYNIWTLQQRAQ